MLAGGPVHRLELSPLIARGGARAGRRHRRATPRPSTRSPRGNPFFVAEALAAPPDAVPASVKDAVLARLRQVSPECRDAVERLSVVPSAVNEELADAAAGRAAASRWPRPSSPG